MAGMHPRGIRPPLGAAIDWMVSHSSELVRDLEHHLKHMSDDEAEVVK
jgi:hypothetical protein